MKRDFNDGKCTLIAIEELAGLSIGIKYFDDDTRIFVAPEIQQKFLDKKLERLDFATLQYRKEDKPIQEIAIEIVEECKRCGIGELRLDALDGMFKQNADHTRYIHEAMNKKQQTGLGGPYIFHPRS
jgi:hypothetical protein